MTSDSQPTADLRGFIRANMLDGDETDTRTFFGYDLLDEVVDWVARWLGDPAGTPPATFTRQQAADWLNQNAQVTP